MAPPIRLDTYRPKRKRREAALAALPTGPLPWADWPTRPRSAFYIRWIETFCTVTEGLLLGRPVKLHAFQKRIIRDLLDGAPPPMQAIVSMPRGNGKTSLEAYLSACHAFTQPGGTVIHIATKEEQAHIPFQQVIAMAEAHPLLEPLVMVRNDNRLKQLVMLHNGSRIMPLPSTVAGLQGRRPSLALVDEVGFVPDDVWSSMALGLGKHRNSLLVGFGTPGFDRGIMWRLRTLALSPDPPKGFLYHEQAAPVGSDIYDERTWRAANPAIRAGFLDIDAVRTNALTESKSNFMTFRLGMWASREEKWLTDAEMDLLSVETGLPEDGTAVVLGFDGSVGGDRRDTTALVGCEVLTGRIFVIAWWSPPEGAPRGWRVPRAEVVGTIDKSMTRWNATLIADPWFWRSELEALAQQYGDERVQQFNSGALARMAPAVDRFAAAVQTGVLVWDGDADLRDHLLAAVVEVTPAGNVIRKDARKVERPNIDLAVAAVLAHHGRGLFVEPTPVAIW